MPTPAEVDAVVTTLTALGQQPDESPAAADADERRRSGSISPAASPASCSRGPTEDGTWETRCVFTVEEGAEFLGLVEDVQ